MLQFVYQILATGFSSVRTWFISSIQFIIVLGYFVFGSMILSIQSVGKPFSCNHQTTSATKDIIEDYCFLNSTTKMEQSHREFYPCIRNSNFDLDTNYFQNVPFSLIANAIFCTLASWFSISIYQDIQMAKRCYDELREPQIMVKKIFKIFKVYIFNSRFECILTVFKILTSSLITTTFLSISILMTNFIIFRGEFFSFGVESLISLITKGHLQSKSTCELFPATFSCEFPVFMKRAVHGNVKITYLSGICFMLDNVTTSKLVFGLWLTFGFAFIQLGIKFIKRCFQFFPCIQRHRIRRVLISEFRGEVRPLNLFLDNCGLFELFLLQELKMW